MSAIINSKLGDLVASSELGAWKETLAILSTYGKSEEFGALCEQLGERLESEARDKKSAALCYLCAINVPRTVAAWVQELAAGDSLALHALVEKVSVFLQGEDRTTVADLGPEVAAHFATYGALLANQGLMATAAKYINTDATSELRHRLFYAAEMDKSDQPPPPLPFEPVNVSGRLCPFRSLSLGCMIPSW